MIDKDNLKYPWMSQFTINANRCSAGGQFYDVLREHLVQGKDLATKIISAFTWSRSPQGNAYWSDLADSYND